MPLSTSDRFASSDDVATMLLNEGCIVVTDGAGFGADGFLRFSYATSMENLERAISVMTGLLGRKA
jgi:aspartate aminotransferase